MPLPLPNLDDLNWDDLTSEARTRIPGAAAEWTDFNPSDPGITLIELFAYHVEALLYRVNRIGRNHHYEILRLVNGPAWEETGQFEQDLTTTLSSLRQPARAVTPADYEAIVSERFRESVARVKCLPGRNLERGSASGPRTRDQWPAHLLLGILRAEVGTVPRALALAGIDRAGLAERVRQALAGTGE